MRKRFTKTIAMLCVCGLALTGCSGDKETNNQEQPSSAQQSVSVESAEKVEEVAANVAPAVTSTLTYEFTGSDADKAGYAEGTITFEVSEAGTYSMYWSDDAEALDGYYEIAKMDMGAAAAQTVEFGYHTAIPADATKVIVVADDKEATVANALAVYDIPENKQLGYKSYEAIYTFNSYSDIHIDEEKWGEAPAYWWEYSEQHWADALDYSAKMGVDFILSTGDQVTNAKLETLDKEYQAYQYILAQSDYVNPIYESSGNHEVRQDGFVEDELGRFVIGTGLDSNVENIQANKPYYSFTEPKTGDLFIVMALEAGYRPAQYDEFTTEQLDWVEALLEENYGTGKNIYLVQHALMKGYGPGDDLETPYYGGAIEPTLDTAVRFRTILETYKDIIWISGHSHETFALDYNYTNNGGESCHMIHNSSVANPTHVTDGALDYAFNEELSQGYLVQTFEKAIIFSGANLVAEKIYPAYCYIIDGDTTGTEVEEKVGRDNLATTAGNVRSIMANANTVLGVNYEYSSYDQYQALKKVYFEYKDTDMDTLTEKELSVIYDEVSKGIATLCGVVKNVERIQQNEPVVVETEVVEEPEVVVEEEQTVTREKPVTVRVHYHREDGDYAPWSVWMWGTGDGTDNAFTGEDDFGVYLEYVADVDVLDLGFIVRTQDWKKDFDGDQFIDLRNITTETYDIYIESGVEGFTTE